MSERPWPEADQPLTLGDKEIGPGERVRFDLVVTSMPTGGPVTMPVEVVRGAKNGPCLLVCAALHGDELNGVAIVRRLLQRTELKKLSGTLVAVPVVNVPGFNTLSRYLPDRRDLNRVFPGSARGSMASRIANAFLTGIVDRCTHVVDLHTGAVHRTNAPQIRVDEDDPESAELARAFGAPIIVNAGLREGSLRAVCADRGQPVIVYEGGEALRFEEDIIEAGLSGVLRTMRHLKMLPGRVSSKKDRQRIIARSSRWLRAPKGGIVELQTSPGATVKKGQCLAILSDPLGKKSRKINAPRKGVVIGLSRLPLVHAGDAIIHLVSEWGHQVAAEDLDLPDEKPEGEAGETPTER